MTLNTGTAGVFSETITLLDTGSNISGYSGTLALQVLTVTGTVVAGQTYTLTTAPVTIPGWRRQRHVQCGGERAGRGGFAGWRRGREYAGAAGRRRLRPAGAGEAGNIQVVTAQETAGETTIDMRSGLNVTVNVVTGGQRVAADQRQHRQRRVQSRCRQRHGGAGFGDRERQRRRRHGRGAGHGGLCRRRRHWRRHRLDDAEHHHRRHGDAERGGCQPDRPSLEPPPTRWC